MKSRAVLIILAVIVAVMGCNEAWAYDTTAFTTVYDTTPWSPALINQFIGPLNRTEQMLRANFSDTTADIDSTGIEDSAIITSKYKNASILDRHIADTAAIDYGKVERNPLMPYARDLQYDSPTVDTTAFQNARIQWGYDIFIGDSTQTMIRTVIFPTPYDTSAIVVPFAMFAGSNPTSGSDAWPSGGSYAAMTVNHIYNASATGFQYKAYWADGTFYLNEYYYVVWWAIGRKD